MATLFELVDEYKNLYELCTEDGDPGVLADTLEAWMPELADKAASYVDVIQRLDMETKKCKEIVADFSAKAKARENSLNVLKETLVRAMSEMDMATLPAGVFTIKLQKNGGKEPLVIDDERSVPDSMLKVIYEIDKEKIREYLNAGNEVPWAHLEPRGQHVVIK